MCLPFGFIPHEKQSVAPEYGGNLLFLMPQGV